MPMGSSVLQTVDSLWQRVWPFVQSQVALILLIVLLLAGSRLSPVFLTPRNLYNILWAVSVLGIVSMGQTILLITANFDMSVSMVVPFAGIAFLWFTGVIRDRLGEHEDKFFATLFLSSGIISVVLFFIWAAIFGAIMGTTALAAVGLADDDIYIFGFALMNQIIGNYALRMAGVYMTAIGTLWARSGVMPRWLTIVTYILALGFLLAAGWAREARFIFPAWVFVVSVYILILNYRRTHDQGGKDGLSADD